LLSITSGTIRIFLHVLAATVWVGGQITLAGLVPGLRELDTDAPRAVARRFNLLAWPAYGVLVLTGIWNLTEVHVGDASTAYQVTLFVKLAVVAISGIAAFLHSNARTRVMLAVMGALTGLAALASLFLGVLLVRNGG
jgi:putative copper export protein